MPYIWDGNERTNLPLSDSAGSVGPDIRFQSFYSKYSRVIKLYTTSLLLNLNFRSQDFGRLNSDCFCSQLWLSRCFAFEDNWPAFFENDLVSIWEKLIFWKCAFETKVPLSFSLRQNYLGICCFSITEGDLKYSLCAESEEMYEKKAWLPSVWD